MCKLLVVGCSTGLSCWLCAGLYCVYVCPGKLAPQPPSCHPRCFCWLPPPPPPPRHVSASPSATSTFTASLWSTPCPSAASPSLLTLNWWTWSLVQVRIHD